MRKSRSAAGLILALLIALTSVVGSPISPVSSAKAASGANFDPSNIISNQKFNDSNSMSAAQIQGFLNSKVSACAGGFTCLKDYSQTTYSKSGDARCATYTGAANESAATIVSKVGIACQISPQVLLVLLQKEQLLVTSTRPSAAAYDHATGYACPDTAACDPTFAGFFDQVYHAAAQFRYYELNPTAFRYQAGKVVSIQYNPDPGCGTQQVYIQNQATANLYIYTPYVPNAAALQNMYGIGDGCSAYGNRNFWSLFSDWFGSPSGPKSTNGSVDLAVGTLNGIEIQGWAVDPFSPGPTYIWVNVDGHGGPARTDIPLNWIENLYPGVGNAHGYHLKIPATAGSHVICVLQTNGTSTGCRTVVVPSSGRSAGEISTITPALGTLTVSGWSQDITSSAPTYVWINVDGIGGPALASGNTQWSSERFPGTGVNHAYSVTLPASVGIHQICVYGTDAVLLGCQLAEVPKNEAGAVVSTSGVIGGVQTTGWSLDQRSPAPTYVWVTVDGTGGPVLASGPSSQATTAYPSVGGTHGFTSLMKTSPGRHTVCVTGTLEQSSYGCTVVTVPNNEVGNVDSVTGVSGGIQVSGWSLDQTSAASTFVWIDVDGKGSAFPAATPLAWMNAYFPGVGANHGISAFVPASFGKHSVCVTGTKERVSLGCFSVSVPSTGAASIDSVVGGVGTMTISGWAVDRASQSVVYIWNTVDGGNGFPIAADQYLPWINAYFPGVGSNHGFSSVVLVGSGTHTICSFLTFDNSALGCRTVSVQ